MKEFRIDPHVHCRDGIQNYKETIQHVFKLCDEAGVEIIFDMPNTDPPVLNAEDVDKRLGLVPHEFLKRYRMYVGVTAEETQIRDAVSLVEDCQYVAGLKLYACRSKDDLAVVTEKKQQRVYRVLAQSGYRGVLAVHCEKESMIDHDAFDPQKPVSHCDSRPPEAETASITDQIKFARAAEFEGKLHICHVSLGNAVNLIKEARKTLDITCGVTPHHLLWSSGQFSAPEGLIYKVNPPLRDPTENIALRKALKAGDIDWIETDHAPHPLSEKLYPPYASGYPSLCLYKSLIEEILPFWGLTKDMIMNVTSYNIQRTFGERIFKYDHRSA